MKTLQEWENCPSVYLDDFLNPGDLIHEDLFWALAAENDAETTGCVLQIPDAEFPGLYWSVADLPSRNIYISG